jgi:hypothetical protein
MKISQILPASLIFFVAACGGGGGGSSSSPPAPPPPPPNVFSGQFKDANTAGLAFATPSRSGTTDTRGAFSYMPGETVEFSLGGVIIGSSPGKSILTPVDLIPGSSVDTLGVQNIARFLLMLDQNDDATDGIFISDGVRQVAANWPQVDFSASDFDNEVVTILSDVASVDARPAALRSQQAAKTHLVGTAHCAMSGFFRGTFTGPRAGILVMLMNSATGRVVAYHIGAISDYESIESVAIDGARTFIASSTSGNGDNFEGRFDSYDEISGVYSIGGDTGEFTVSRRLPDATARFRFAGRYYRGAVGQRLTGPLVINVDDQGNLLVEGYDLSLDNTFSATGTFIDNEFNYDYGDGQRQFGTTDSQLYVAGSGSTVNGSPRPWFAQGCRLN